MNNTDRRAAAVQDKAIARQTRALLIKALAIKPVAFAGCFLSIPMTAISSVIVPLLVSIIIQHMINHQYQTAMHLTWLTGGLMIVGIAIKWIWNHEFNITGIEGSKYLHKLAFDHFMKQDYSFFSNQYTGALASYQQKLITSFIDYSNILVLGIPQIATIIIGSVVVLFFKSVTLGFVTLISMAAIVAVTAIAASLRLKQRRDVSYHNGRLAGQLSDSLTHASTVQSLAKEQYESQRLDHYVAYWARSQARVWESYIYADAARTLLHTIMFVAILLTSLDLFRHGSITVASVALVQLYTIRMLDNTIQIAELIKRNQTDMSDAYQMMVLFQQQPTITDPDQPKVLKVSNKLSLNFNNVSFAYSDGSPEAKVLNDFSLTIKPGEKIGLVGPSGAGKTTITKLLLRFNDVTAGSITIDDKDIRDVHLQALRNLIAYVPQEPLLFHRSIRENIAYANEAASDAEVNKAADQARITNFAKELPDGLNTLVGERGVKLSGGQRQRVVIARAMLRKAPILVLDEATSALDSETESFIQESLWQLMTGKTAVIVAHRLSTIQRMDRIIVINNGKLIEQGSHKQLLAKKDGLYAKLWTHQSGGFLGDV